jgi:hypothetical protein
MIALRLVHLIESHSEELAEGITQKLLTSPRTRTLRSVPANELHLRCHEVYRNLSDWILTKTETEIESVYSRLGARRAQQGVDLASLTWALMLTKENLFDFLAREGMHGTAESVFGELELLRSLDQFFDRAIYHAVVGFEKAVASQAAV